MRIFKTLFLGAILALCGHGAFANESVFGGAGVNLMPIKNDQIRMADEHVILQQTTSGWHIEVTFHFKNDTDKKQKLLVGFPFRGHYLDPLMGYDDYDERKTRNFKATVRGKPVKTRQIKLEQPKPPVKEGDDEEFDDEVDEEPYYTHAYVWDVEFAPNEQVEIFNSYDQGESYTPFGVYNVYYILMTGKNWKGGKIGRSLIEVRFIEDVVLCHDARSASDGEPVGEWSPCEDPVEPDSPPGYRLEGKGRNLKVIWDLKDFTPEEDLDLNFTHRYAYLEKRLLKWEDLDPDTESNKKLSCNDLRIIRNTYYAILGYPFKNAELKAHFGKQPWYKPNPEFDLKKMPARQRDWLKSKLGDVRDIQKRRGCRN